MSQSQRCANDLLGERIVERYLEGYLEDCLTTWHSRLRTGDLAATRLLRGLRVERERRRERGNLVGIARTQNRKRDDGGRLSDEKYRKRLGATGDRRLLLR
ncbi:hypothetical protein KP509_02G020500 [Ceratopteris richardii]|uniref:Uncharacterized protein n=1 Tax=Ceratopteris richardii TaxID=49495 RepID=A0A8T2V3R6_CERRI|nr:hypothetical protein KP509_02G020500 [Ceratopteris richardii]